MTKKSYKIISVVTLLLMFTFTGCDGTSVSNPNEEYVKNITKNQSLAPDNATESSSGNSSNTTNKPNTSPESETPNEPNLPNDNNSTNSPNEINDANEQ